MHKIYNEMVGFLVGIETVGFPRRIENEMPSFSGNRPNPCHTRLYTLVFLISQPKKFTEISEPKPRWLGSFLLFAFV
jgi:hypothetical protein